MIWVLIIGLCLAVCAYVARPLYSKNPMSDDVTVSQKNEVSAYRDELQNIEEKIEAEEGEAPSLVLQKIAFQKRLLKSATTASPTSEHIKPTWVVGTFITLVAGTIGIYALIGSPALTQKGSLSPATLSAPQALSQNTPDVQHENNASMEDLIAGLEKKLQAGSQNPQQWGLYARSLMTLNRFEDAFSAYEKTLSLTNDNPEILAELESARAFAVQQRAPQAIQNGPNREDIEAAAQMAPSDRAAMIQGMVDGLSAKLQENPNDPQGWVRLLRARKVLGQSEIAKTEIQTLKKHFENEPEIASDILLKSGWNN